MTKKITKTEALSLLVRAVAEKGEDFRDTGLHVYFDDYGKPSCGVGLALSYVGLNKNHAGYSNAGSVYSLAGRLNTLPYSPIKIDREAVQVLETFRKNQDRQQPWGDCLAAAARV